jgi:tRNA U55 pseudouridine synthase TruB
MVALRRTRAGVFAEDDAEFTTLDRLGAAASAWRRGDETMLRALLVPAEIVGTLLPTVFANEEAEDSLLAGMPLLRAQLTHEVSLQTGEHVAVFCGERFIEVARAVNDDEVLARPQFVMTRE